MTVFYIGPKTVSIERLSCLCPVMLLFFDMRFIGSVGKSSDAARQKSVCVVEGGFGLLLVLEQFKDMFGHVKRVETFFNKSGMRWEILSLSTGPPVEGSVRIIDGTSLADMIVG